MYEAAILPREYIHHDLQLIRGAHASRVFELRVTNADSKRKKDTVARAVCLCKAVNHCASWTAHSGTSYIFRLL
jgi:hypothetical protein